MKPDPDVIKTLLDAFERHPKPFPSLYELRELGVSLPDSEVLAFHLLLMEERGLLASVRGKPGVGVSVCASGEVVVSNISLRLTATGHDFAQQLRDPVVYEKVATVMGTSGLGVAVSVAGAIVTQLATRALGLTSP